MIMQVATGMGMSGKQQVHEKELVKKCGNVLIDLLYSILVERA